MWLACQSTRGSNMAGRAGRVPTVFVGGVIFGHGVVEDGCLQTTDITPPEV